jgi:hypothetical protein
MTRLLVIVERWSWGEAATRKLHGGIKATGTPKQQHPIKARPINWIDAAPAWATCKFKA